ncbi:hypothetical protein [Geomesophilobacter sediminis]|uniref:Uncharacterized protein n=1 Tax=Geomesophilobacter sediminis TaxID=2798584 RepID=A0A8J7JLS3_9BACT|nr:hypothetical protein [Geomesophilobacter sediminis]MBJ6725210.1 hypothetical protein [Geomesophilobacter sediminis]
MKREGNSHQSLNDKICMIENDRLLNKLSDEATACCAKCGARAHDPSSLCSPVRLNGSR